MRGTPPAIEENSAADHADAERPARTQRPRARVLEQSPPPQQQSALELVLSASFEHQTVALTRPPSSRSGSDHHLQQQQPAPHERGPLQKRAKSGHLQPLRATRTTSLAAAAWVERQHREEPSAPLSAAHLSFSCCEIATLDSDALVESALSVSGPPVIHPRSRSVPRRSSSTTTADLLNGTAPLAAAAPSGRSSKVLFLL